MNEIDARAAEITRFWREAGPEAWFKKDAGFDVETLNSRPSYDVMRRSA